MRRKTSSKNRWADHYTRQAQKERYPARSVYKLKEMQAKYRLLKKGDRVLDLGCAPGSWLLYAAEVTGPGGQVHGIDLQAVTVALPAHVTVTTGDIYAVGEALKAEGRTFDVVLSDMAPATSGNKSVDAARSLALCEAALDVAQAVLAPGGTFVCKIFQGADFKAFSETVKSGFKQHKNFKPQSSRKASKEIFIVGVGKH